MRVWTSAPPSSSAVTSSPVAAFTSGGPPRKIVPLPFTMIVSSLMAGPHPPPARGRAPNPAALRGARGPQARPVAEEMAEGAPAGENPPLAGRGRARARLRAPAPETRRERAVRLVVRAEALVVRADLRLDRVHEAAILAAGRRGYNGGMRKAIVAAASASVIVVAIVAAVQVAPRVPI